MIRVNEEYAIGYDKMNIILYRINVKGEKSKNPGEERPKAIGFYGSFKHLVKKLLDDKLLHDKPDTLEKVLETIETFEKDITNAIIELDPNTVPYKYDLDMEKE